MTILEQHHDLSLMLLVGRALPTGLPWTPEEDQTLVARERLLWVQLTEEERKQEQTTLASLWGKRGAHRTISARPSWGSWVEGLGEVVIPDVAFGMAESQLRPLVRGIQILTQEHPELAALLEWLWLRGFYPVECTDGVLMLLVPPQRIVQESERLVGVLLRDWPTVPVKSPTTGATLTVKGSYDPVTGKAAILLSGIVPTDFH